MTKQRRSPDKVPRPSEEFQKFRQTMRRLLAVSKKELDDLRAAERAKAPDKNKPTD